MDHANSAKPWPIQTNFKARFRPRKWASPQGRAFELNTRRDEIVGCVMKVGRYKATWKWEFKIPRRKAGLLKPSRPFGGFEPVGCQ